VTLAVDPVHAGGEWARHAPHRSDLLGRAATPTDGRWQRGEHVPGLYLAEDTATAVAEWYRFLAELGIPPGRAVPHDHHLGDWTSNSPTSAARGSSPASAYRHRAPGG